MTARHAETTGERVRLLRKARGWSFDELAQRSGVGKAALLHLEHDRTAAPQSRTLGALAQTFAVPVAVLAGEGDLPTALACDPLQTVELVYQALHAILTADSANPLAALKRWRAQALEDLTRPE